MQRNYKGGVFSLIELLLVLAIILFFSYKALNSYFKKPDLDKNTEKALSQQGINTSNYGTILNSTRSQVQDINRRLIKRTDFSDAVK